MLDTIIWIPTERVNVGKIRPLADKDEFRQAISVLQGEPEEISPNLNTRKKQISDAIEANTPAATASIVRDLWGKRQETGDLNTSERKAYELLRNRLVQEWSLCFSLNIEEAYRKMSHILNQITGAASRDIRENDRRMKVQDRLLVKLQKKDPKWA
jgi:RNA polymerase-interacting CarD/CdnL/TRCF family regulator